MNDLNAYCTYYKRVKSLPSPLETIYIYIYNIIHVIKIYVSFARSPTRYLIGVIPTRYTMIFERLHHYYRIFYWKHEMTLTRYTRNGGATPRGEQFTEIQRVLKN